jgi:hypothetical protein
MYLHQLFHIRARLKALAGLASAALLACGSPGGPGLNTTDVGDDPPPDSTPPPPPTDTTPPPPPPDTTPPPPPTDSTPPPPPPDSFPEPSGLPFGPIGLWNSDTTVSWGPLPFSASHNYTHAGGIIAQVNTARAMRHRLVLAMTGGLSTRYSTNGQFDFVKWTNRMDTFNTPAIRDAVAAGVADGTIIGNQLIDEPETRRWGGVINKATIDQMARYAKDIFPTLPMAVNHGPPAHHWRASERYQVLDYVIYQYNHWITAGDIVAWREEVLAQARQDGVTPAFSLNVLDGGVQDRGTNYSCTGPGQAGRGTYHPNCRMTPDQVRTWAREIGGAGCAMFLWRYEPAFMSAAANLAVFEEVAERLSQAPKRSCRRL